MNDAQQPAILPVAKVGTGIAGLDEVLGGGFPMYRLHLIEGGPGAGKTTLGLQFLMEGARRGESVLYVTLSETVEELQAIASSHGWSLEGIQLHELGPTEDSLDPEAQYTIVHPAEVELGERTWSVLEQVERVRPSRVVIDSLAELELLARDQLRYRRQILGLKRYFAGRGTTVLLLDNMHRANSGVESIAHGVLQVEQLTPEYGGERRRMRVMKLRGAKYRGGFHDMLIETGGITVFPRLVAAEHREAPEFEAVPSGLPELDRLLGGGLDRGTSALLAGPAGVGKSILASHYAAAAAARDECVAVFIFDEAVGTYLHRSDGLGLPIRAAVESGRISVRPLDPAELSLGQFNQMVRDSVDRDHARLIIVDSLNGYLNAMAEERAVTVQLHELLSYLGNRGVLTLLTMAQHGMVGGELTAPLDVSYLADSVILLRYFEAAGQLRRAISVVKKRSGMHEPTIRELRLSPPVQVGDPLTQFSGILSLAPHFVGENTELLTRGNT